MLRLLSRLSIARTPQTPHIATPLRLFTVYSPLAKNLPPRPKPPPESEIEEQFLKGSGPGGQKINKTSSAVQLKHVPTGIVVKSQATRSRDQNRKHARQLLANEIDKLLNGDQSRSAIVGQVKKKKADSAAKKSRRKYKKLAEEKQALHATQHDQSDVKRPESSQDTSQPPRSTSSINKTS
ncbi:hypothetical protein CDD82_2698 [Ophiocordyceps australis]|uniref:Prokaryotic-type class I peptide chain release factors domain-containing protein n=1 Tax=Ophiocordyceps australis TaxID=1399860 RepID=A0A2C5XTP0_9HYPO|nr:hypothetical protein CDD82_2698 [Ophiocordyceps australis]